MSILEKVLPALLDQVVITIPAMKRFVDWCRLPFDFKYYSLKLMIIILDKYGL